MCCAHYSPHVPPHAAACVPAAKTEGDQLFECFDAQDLNVRLKDLMDGLSVKVGGRVGGWVGGPLREA